MGFPDRGKFSFIFAYLYWRKIHDLKEKMGLKIGGEGRFVAVEFYEKHLEQNHHYYLPIAGDVDAYQFSSFSRPPYKAD